MTQQSIWQQNVLPRFEKIAKRLQWQNLLDVVSTTPENYDDRLHIPVYIPDNHPEKKHILVQGTIEYVLTGDYTLKFRLWFDNGSSILCNFPKFAKENHEQFPNGKRITLQVRPVRSRFHDPDQDTLGHHTTLWVCMYPKVIQNNTTGKIKAIYKAMPGASSEAIEEAVSAHLDILEQAFPQHSNEFATLIMQVHRPTYIQQAEHARKAIAKREVVKIANDIIKKQTFLKQPIMFSEKILNHAIQASGFTPTQSQARVLHDLQQSLAQDKEQRHILNADVGMGKTFVACVLTACVAAIEKHDSTIPPVAVIAPTSILADQLAHEFAKMFPKMGVWRHGQPPKQKPHVVIGTTSVFSVYPNNQYPRLLIVDEEHRFGVEHRDKLIGDNTAFLSMTATPIPRSAGMLLCGGARLHQLTDRPKPRNVRTILESGSAGRKRALDAVINHLQNENGKVLVIYPAVNSEKMNNIETAYGKWKKLWPELGVIHSQIKDANHILQNFKDSKFRLLLASTRVEIGIDVSDATMILIIDAERFGLATLHQLRGRVGRGGLPGICTLISDNLKARERLTFFCQCTNGIELAEYDLKKRGMGEINGEKQSGHMFRFFSISKDFEMLNEIQHNQKCVNAN